MRNYVKYLIHRVHSSWGSRPRIILDRHRKLGNFGAARVGYQTDLCKEHIAREYVIGRAGTGQTFLDMGGKDGVLTYLLGIRDNLDFNQEFYEKNKAQFDAKYSYFGIDLRPAGENVLAGDICSQAFLDDHAGYLEFFDVIYSNNVLEHLRRPWIAAENLSKMLKPGGVLITIVPFSQRYHEDPEDFFRYTHAGVVSLFEAHANFQVLVNGYDIRGRRTDWQGSGKANDIVPTDNFGAWRETWFTVSVLRKQEPTSESH